MRFAGTEYFELRRGNTDLAAFLALGSNVDGTLTGKEGLYEFEFDANGKFAGLRRHHLP